MTTQTTDQQLVIPDYPEAADGPQALYGMVTGGLESRLVKRYLNTADRTTRNPTPQVGEMSVLLNTGEVDICLTAGTWTFLLFAGKGALGDTQNVTLISPATITINSTSYQNVTGATVTINKLLASSRLLVRFNATAYLSSGAANPKLTFGVLANAVATDIFASIFSVSGTIQTFTGEKTISGVPAGSQAVQLQAKVDTTPHSIIIDNLCSVTWTVQEVL